jgi:hypothetical protein
MHCSKRRTVRSFSEISVKLDRISGGKITVRSVAAPRPTQSSIELLASGVHILKEEIVTSPAVNGLSAVYLNVFVQSDVKGVMAVYSGQGTAKYSLEDATVRRNVTAVTKFAQHEAASVGGFQRIFTRATVCGFHFRVRR